MVPPKPASPSRTALFGWLLGREHDASALPPLVSAFEAWKRDRAQDPPDVPFLMLTSRPLDAATWATIARRASWQTLRMNLNTITEVKRPTSADQITQWRDGYAWLAGGTWLFSEPQIHTDTLIDLDQLNWPALQSSQAGLEIAAT